MLEAVVPGLGAVAMVFGQGHETIERSSTDPNILDDYGGRLSTC